MVQHTWNDEFCSCGQDAVTCQVCGGRICGNVAVRINGKNVCPSHINPLRVAQARAGMGS